MASASAQCSTRASGVRTWSRASSYVREAWWWGGGGHGAGVLEPERCRRCDSLGRALSGGLGACEVLSFDSLSAPGEY